MSYIETGPDIGRVGELESSNDSFSLVDIIWKIDDFLTVLQQPNATMTSQDFGTLGFKGFFAIDPGVTTQDNISFKAVIFRRDIRDGKIYFKLFLKSNDGTLKEFVVQEEFTQCFTSNISKPYIVENKDTTVPGGVLTVLVKLSSNEDLINDRWPINESEISGRVGELQLFRETPTSVDITWKIRDFLTLPYRPDAGIISPDFNSLCFRGYFVMNPKGSTITPSHFNFRSLIFHNEYPRRIRVKLFLKDEDDALKEFVVKKEFGQYFICDIPRSEIAERQEALVPEGFLTVLFRLTIDDGEDLASDDAPSLEGITNVGELNFRTVSSSEWEISWMIKNFFTFPEYRTLAQSFEHSSVLFFIHITQQKIFASAGITELTLDWRFKSNISPENILLFPKRCCEFYLKTREGTLYNIAEQKYFEGEEAGRFGCKITWSEIFERKEYLVPKGVLSVVVKLSSEQYAITDTHLQTASSTSNIAMDAREPTLSEKQRRKNCV